jgi:Helix-turn-helix.
MNIADNITHNGVYDTDVQCVRVFECSSEGKKMIYKGGDRDAIGFTKIKYYRKTKHLTQKQVAEMLGISQQSYVAKENNLREFTIHEIIELLKILDIKFESLLK